MGKVVWKKKTLDVAFSEHMTVDELKAVLSTLTGLHPHRQSLKVQPAENAPADKVVRLSGGSKKLSEYVEARSLPAATLVLSDMGPQFSYRGVFVVEYLGPILIMLLYWSRPAFIYGADAAAAPPAGWVARLCVAIWLLHFVKRELETLFVHKFSRPTMPLSNLFKNSMYYWGFAVVVGYPLCHPAYTAPASEAQTVAGVSLMLAAELVNLLVHLQLAGMRPAAAGADSRVVPSGPLFSLVSCPNYTAELLCWVGFSLATQVGSAYLFTLVGALQMSQWALQKHRGYVRQDPRLKRRSAIIPYVL